MNPLRGVLRESFRLYGRHAARLMLIAFAMSIAGFAVQVPIGLIPVAGGILRSAAALIAAFLTQAALVAAARDAVGSGDESPRSLAETVAAGFPALAGVTCLALLTSAVFFFPWPALILLRFVGFGLL